MRTKSWNRRDLLITIGAAGARGNVYAGYAEIFPDEVKIVGVAEPISFRRHRMAELELDHKTNLTWIKHCLAGRSVFLGNLDPVSVLEQGSPTQVQEKVLELLNLFEDEPGFILNSGCAIPPDTTEENIKSMISTIRNL